ncbi:hypothetical protein [Sneathiella glossodoripedis]|uniref:hypothetical protein n=1 Tax=Sneathiella glossodoripedis TaxID=418853 RepID=UPI00047237D1|nr:hypothetical protein [Sneathiella glossodoripedis]
MITRLIAFLLFILAPALAQANVNSVTPSPSSVAVAVVGAPRVTVTWTVNRTAATTATVSVTSANADLRVGGVVVSTLGNILSQSSSLIGGQSETLRFTETLVLTPAQANTVATSDAGSVTITRTFTDTETTLVGTMQVAAGGGNTGDLQLRRIDLSFENDARADVIRQGDRQRAVARVSYRSSGLLKGEWRIVDPTSNYGSARYRILQVVRQQLVSSGQGETRIVSPPLPTQKNGLYLVTFVAEDESGVLDFPVLRYFVLQGSTEAPVENLDVVSPAEGAILATDTVFSWSYVKGAYAYQIELFEPASEDIVTGKLVGAETQNLNFSVFSLDRLKPGQVYDWRLRAIDRGGKILGVSARRKIMMPQ